MNNRTEIQRGCFFVFGGFFYNSPWCMTCWLKWIKSKAKSLSPPSNVDQYADSCCMHAVYVYVPSTPEGCTKLSEVSETSTCSTITWRQTVTVFNDSKYWKLFTTGWLSDLLTASQRYRPNATTDKRWGKKQHWVY